MTAFLAALMVPAAAQAPPTLNGPVTVVDSDAISVGGTTVLLFGVDSVERRQICRIDGQVWECHAAAVRELETLSSLGTVTCEVLSEPDVYRRVLGTCFIDGLDLGEMFVRSGYAVARPEETDAYVAAEEAARAEGVGLWRSEFILPADFRVINLVTEVRPVPF